MSVRQYVGARYVPRFSTVNGGVWDNTYSYEALEIVKYGNDYYTSKKPVPTGVAITNTEYWVLTGNYNGAIGELDNKINALTSSFNAIFDSFVGKYIEANSPVTATTPAMQVVNYGGQGDATLEDMRSFVVHHYTDGECARLDNVGTAPILTLVNAHNAQRRPDKPSNFHGTGDYERLVLQHDFDGDEEYSQDLIGITQSDGDLWRSGLDNTGNPTRNHIFGFHTNKLYGDTYAFLFEALNTHDYFMLMRSGTNNFMIIRHNGTHGFRIEPADNTAFGVLGGSGANVTVKGDDGVQVNMSAGNTFRINFGGTLKHPAYDENFCTSSTRPTTGLYNGLTYKETDTHKIIWYLNGNWYDGAGNLV